MEKNYWFWLSHIVGVGDVRIRKLLSYFDDNPEELYYASKDCLRQVGFLKETEIDDICSENMRLYAWEQMKEYEELGVGFVTPNQSNYPHNLKNIYDKPFILYYRGSLPDSNRRAVGIVGSRRCSEYGRSIATEIARQLAAYQIDIISGLAIGIDAYAHRGALDVRGQTHAVLAGDVDKCYPMQNFNLYMDILEKGGGVLSERPPGTVGQASFFPQRNRIICGLCNAVIIVEAGRRSGTLITAHLATEQNKDVLVVPGRIGDPNAIGCNELIAEGAEIIPSIEGLLARFGLADSKKKSAQNSSKIAQNDKKTSNMSLAPSQKLLYSQLLDFTPRSLESLLEATKLSVSEALSALVSLELNGFLREVSKNLYVRVI